MHELDREAWATEHLDSMEDDMARMDHAFEPMRYSQTMVNAALAKGRMKHALESVGWVNPDFDSSNSDKHSVEDGLPMENESAGENIEVASHTLSGWRDLLAEQRKAAIAKKAQGIPDTDNVNGSKKTGESEFWEDQVRVIDKSFLSKKHKSEEDDINILMDKIVEDFTLNEEQERAFRIIANHSTLGAMADPLRMYIGGMAGTGKSQVIKALIKFFEGRGKSYAFLILAPTGSAASLVGGSTYHSALGFRGGNNSEDGGKGDKDLFSRGMTTK